MTLRRQFVLLDEDEKFLQDYGLPWETVVDGSQWVLIHDFPLPDGYNNSRVAAAIRMETGYPTSQLDMVYFHPPITRKDGKVIGATTFSLSSMELITEAEGLPCPILFGCVGIGDARPFLGLLELAERQTG